MQQEIEVSNACGMASDTPPVNANHNNTLIGPERIASCDAMLTPISAVSPAHRAAIFYRNGRRRYF